MSNWKGDSNPGHSRRVARWRAIEAEFDEPLADTIMGLREQGNSWRTVAGALDVALSTLQEWRRVLGLPLDQRSKMFDPSSTPEHSPTDLRAMAQGYASATDAVLDMRMRRKMTLQQAAQELGVCVDTVLRYTPKSVRGSIYNRSEYWWQQRRQWARDMTQRWIAKYRGRDSHPFSQAERARIQQLREHKHENSV